MRAPIVLVSEEWLESFRSAVRYDAETGNIYWLVSRKGVRRSKGLLAGTVKRYGYRYIRWKGHELLAHRLVYMLHHGVIADRSLEIDHINADKSDNRIENLRAVTHKGNRQNQIRPQSNNRSGFQGVWYHPHLREGRRYVASVRVDGKNNVVGCFPTPEEAHEAYKVAKRNLHDANTL